MFYLHHLFRSLLPLHNPIGFGGVDFIELFVAAVLIGLTLAWPRWSGIAQRFAARTAWCMIFLAALPIALRLALLRTHPIPEPAVADDFSYLLLADTLSHFRLANPPHPLHQFFETFFALQQPTYSSVYPLGQGIALALGRALFGHPWAGVALTIGIFCALCYWMLRGWTTPGWALLGGLFAVIEFGPLSQWMNSYWGGAVSAIAGCMVFGALPRLRDHGRARDAIILGAGLGVELLSRPFESIFLVVSSLLFVLPHARRLVGRAPVFLAALLPAVVLTLVQNYRVTGNWRVTPYSLSQYQYGIPASFTFQSNPVPHLELTREQRLDYQIQSSVHGAGTDTLGSYFLRLGSRVRFYRFFFLPPLYIALVAFLAAWKTPSYWWMLATLILFSFGSNFYPYFYSHYIAALACLFLLMAIAGLQKLGPVIAPWIVFMCVAQFGMWYAAHVTGDPAMWQFETWDAINCGDPDGRIAVNRQLALLPGKQLVFVRYGPQHTFKEWVYNAAGIDASRVVWARDLGTVENELLRRYYPDRTVWLLEPDRRPVQLQPYPTIQPERPAPNPQRPHLKFEEVH